MSEMPSMEPDEFEIPAELPSTTRTTRGARGRPKGKTTTTTVTRQILTDPEDEEKPPEMTFASLFDAGPDDSNNEVVARVRVFRSEPREGHLGYIDDMDATETFIKEHWGGSTYRLEGVNSRGRIVRVRTIAVAGDPIFVGEAFEAQWRRQKGLGPRGASTGESMSMKDMLAVIEAREQALRTELAAKEERDRRERTERDESRRRDEREFLLQREQSQREWDERKRRDTEESDRRRAQEQDARDERRRRDVEEASTRQQQFMTQMLTIVQSQAANTIVFVKETLSGKPTSDPSDMLMKGVTLAMKLREAGESDEGEGDLLTTVVKNLPEMLNSASGAITGAIREVKGLPPQAPKAAAASGGLTLPPGPVSAKFAALVNRIQASGGDPEATLGALADRLLASAPVPAKAPRPNAPVFDPGPPAPQPQAAPAPSTTPQSANSNGTTEPAPKAPPEEGVVRMSFGKPKAKEEATASPVVE